MTEFETALARFIDRLADRDAAHKAANFPSLDADEWYADKGGRKYVRIVRDNGCQRFVYCFVEKATGLIWKADGWKGPVKNFARGSIYDAKPEDCGSVYGV